MIAPAILGALCFCGMVWLLFRSARREEWSDIDIFDAEFLRGLNQQQHSGEVQSDWLRGVSVGAEIDNNHGGHVPQAAE